MRTCALPTAGYIWPRYVHSAMRASSDVALFHQLRMRPPASPSAALERLSLRELNELHSKILLAVVRAHGVPAAMNYRLEYADQNEPRGMLQWIEAADELLVASQQGVDSDCLLPGNTIHKDGSVECGELVSAQGLTRCADEQKRRSDKCGECNDQSEDELGRPEHVQTRCTPLLRKDDEHRDQHGVCHNG